MATKIIKPIGLHIHSRRAGAMARRYIEAVRPPVVKWLEEGIDPVLVSRANDLGALTIGRVYERSQSLEVGRSAAYLGRVRSAIDRHPEIKAWEGFNEAFQGPDELARRADFDLELMRLCERHGKKAVIGSFSVGQPRVEDWHLYLPALRHAAAHRHYVGLHEYGAPAMQWGAGANQPGDLHGGRWVTFDLADRPGVLGWFVLRYRRAVAEWRRLGLANVPRIVITESGLDNVHPRPDVGPRRGYKTYRGSEWWDHPLLGDYASQLAWVCDRWAEDDYLVGGVDFGYADASGEWDDFDLATDPDTLTRVMHEMRGLEGAPAPPAPLPQPPPAVSPVDGRRYRAHVVQPGDTLWGLFGSRWREIQRTVPMGSPRELEVGAVVMIPEER